MNPPSFSKIIPQTIQNRQVLGKIFPKLFAIENELALALVLKQARFVILYDVFYIFSLQKTYLAIPASMTSNKATSSNTALILIPWATKPKSAGPRITPV